jgi:hypothetical protein
MLLPRNELCVIVENARAEIRKLEKHRPKFVGKDIDGIYELFKLGIAIEKNLFVSYFARDLQRENESGRGLD